MFDLWEYSDEVIEKDLSLEQACAGCPLQCECVATDRWAVCVVWAERVNTMLRKKGEKRG